MLQSGFKKQSKTITWSAERLRLGVTCQLREAQGLALGACSRLPALRPAAFVPADIPCVLGTQGHRLQQGREVGGAGSPLLPFQPRPPRPPGGTRATPSLRDCFFNFYLFKYNISSQLV